MATLQMEGLAQSFEDARCDDGGFGLVLDVVEQNRELVSTDSSDDGLPVSTRARTPTLAESLRSV